MTSSSTWVRIGRLTFLRRMTLAATGAGVFFVLYPGFVLGPQLTGILLPEVAFLPRLLLSILGGLILTLAALAIAASLYPGLHVRADGSEVRFRSRVSSAADLDRASVLGQERSRGRQDLVLQLGAGGHATRLWLRSRKRVLLGEDERAVLARAIERSSIAPPESVHDPSGRFAHYNFPGSLTKQEALALVRTPGDPGPLDAEPPYEPR